MTEIDQLVNKWLDLDTNDITRQEIKDLYSKLNFVELEKRLGSRIQFGTAGLRAKMEAGFSRMNDLTVLQASQGLAVYVETNVDNAKSKGIVIGHDHRHNSARFAELTSIAFAHRGFKVHLFDSLVHTPLVPFAVDHLKAACGVMITASHNPAQDNGYKVYWSNGCQIIPPHDTGIAKSIEENLEPWTWKLDNKSLIQPLNLHDEYIDSIFRILFHEKPLAPKNLLKFVYTPIHGVGQKIMEDTCIKILGPKDKLWHMESVPDQALPDPDFPTVKFPNPEEKGALDRAFAVADQIGYTLVLANDPDADRFAVAVKGSDNKWKQLNGNEIGAIFAYFVISQASDASKIALINSTVSSQLIGQLAKDHSMHYEDTLTGFKWIGNKAIQLEKQGYDVPFAFEEALGYMFSVVHDKDGISAAAIFLWLVIKFTHTSLPTGPQLLDLLDKIYQETGYFKEHNSYYISDSPQITDETFKYIRSNAVDKTKLGSYTITGWRDLTTGYDSTTVDHKPLLPVSASSQMITCTLTSTCKGETIRFTARGSGTEPKLKVYIEAKADTADRSQTMADEIWDLLSKNWFRPDNGSGLHSID